MTDCDTTPPPDTAHRSTCDIDLFFNLTYTNYLVLHRTLLQSMPEEWQHRFVACIEELQAAFHDVETAPVYDVKPAREVYPSDLSAADRAALGVTCVYVTPDGEEHQEDPSYIEYDGTGPDRKVIGQLTADVKYYDDRGTELDPDHVLIVPSGDDPVPHYNRTRTRVEPDLDAVRELIKFRLSDDRDQRRTGVDR